MAQNKGLQGQTPTDKMLGLLYLAIKVQTHQKKEATQ